jgi:hypothetical protein
MLTTAELSLTADPGPSRYALPMANYTVGQTIIAKVGGIPQEATIRAVV